MIRAQFDRFSWRDFRWLKKIASRLAWGKIVSLMIKGMDLGPVQGEQSQVKVEAELDWLDGLLSDRATWWGTASVAPTLPPQAC